MSNGSLGSAGLENDQRNKNTSVPMELTFFQSRRARNKVEQEVKVSQMAGRTMEKNVAGRGEAMAEELPASWLDLALRERMSL